MSGQFGSFDNLADRKELMILLQRLGTDTARADFVRRVYALSPLWRDSCRTVKYLTPSRAYFLLVHICGVLGVSIEQAAALLDEEVRKNGVNPKGVRAC